MREQLKAYIDKLFEGTLDSVKARDFHDELLLHYEVVEYANINGLPCLLFEDTEHSLSGFAYKTDDNFTLLGTVMPPEPDEWRDYTYFIN
ncbi:MAG: hypothetical protein Q4G47_08270, partial [Lachnospiraceae bacterium]|nr:hypothetical protein [Lachnospiraceae bacterium]